MTTIKPLIFTNKFIKNKLDKLFIQLNQFESK